MEIHFTDKMENVNNALMNVLPVQLDLNVHLANLDIFSMENSKNVLIDVIEDGMLFQKQNVENALHKLCQDA